MHRLRYHRHCREGVLSPEQLSWFILLSLQAIPAVLERLEARATCSNRRSFAALITSRLAVCNGTRLTLFSEREFMNISQESRGHQICVASHKTNYSFGECPIVMSAKEYSWLRQFHTLRHSLSVFGGEIEHLFFKSGGKSNRNLRDYVYRIFDEFGLGTRDVWHIPTQYWDN